jgi:outer membrane autotransporter protein
MLVSTKKNNLKLAQACLTSSIFIASISYMHNPQAATIDINGANVTPVISGDDYRFLTDDSLIINDAITIGQTAGVSAINNTGGADAGAIIFQGDSTVAGTVGVGGNGSLRQLTFNGIAGKTVTIVGETFVRNIDFDNGGTTNFTDDVTVNFDISSKAAAVVNFNGKLNMTGVGVSFEAGSTVNFAGQTDFNGTLLVDTASSATFNDAVNNFGVGGADVTVNNNSTLFFKNTAAVNIFTQDLLINTASEVTFETGAAANITQRLKLTGGSILNLDSGTTTLSIRLDNASQVNFNNNYTITNNLIFTNDGIAQVASGKTVTINTDLIDNLNGSQLIFDFQNTATPGQFAVVGNANINDTQTVTILNVNTSAYAVGLTTQDLVTAGAGIDPLVPALIAPNSAFISFALDSSMPTALRLITTRRMVLSGLDKHTIGVAEVLATVTNTNSTGALVALVDAWGNVLNADAQRRGLASVAPLIDGGITAAVIEIQNNTFGLFAQRIAELQAGVDNYHTGYAAGSINEHGHGTWVKLFGNLSSQNERDDVEGYKAETWGVALGTDIMLTDRALMGLALSWGSVDLNHDLNDGDTDINSYQAALYGSWNICGPLYFNWMGSAAYNDYSTTRHTIMGVFNQTTLADYDGWQYGARGELGYVLGEKAFHVTPTASLTYAHVDIDGYREKGVSTVNQFVNYDDFDALLIGAGIKFSYNCQLAHAILSPEMHANIAYDVISDEQKAHAQFVQFGPIYETIGAAPARMDYNLGLSLTTYAQSGLGLSISYDFDWKHDYHAHAGFVRVRYEW